MGGIHVIEKFMGDSAPYLVVKPQYCEEYFIGDTLNYRSCSVPDWVAFRCDERWSVVVEELCVG